MRKDIFSAIRAKESARQAKKYSNIRTASSEIAANVPLRWKHFRSLG